MCKRQYTKLTYLEMQSLFSFVELDGISDCVKTTGNRIIDL